MSILLIIDTVRPRRAQKSWKIHAGHMLQPRVPDSFHNNFGPLQDRELRVRRGECEKDACACTFGKMHFLHVFATAPYSGLPSRSVSK